MFAFTVSESFLLDFQTESKPSSQIIVGMCIKQWLVQHYIYFFYFIFEKWMKMTTISRGITIWKCFGSCLNA